MLDQIHSLANYRYFFGKFENYLDLLLWILVILDVDLETMRHFL
jgi:hypothetical protein